MHHYFFKLNHQLGGILQGGGANSPLPLPDKNANYIINTLFCGKKCLLKLRSHNIHIYNTSDPHRIVECIKQVFDQNYSSLGSLFEDSIDIIASDMLQAGLISRHVAKKPTFHQLINEFTSGMMFMRKADEIINHFIKFLKVLSEMKGPFVFAAKKLKEDIHDIINSRLGIEASRKHIRHEIENSHLSGMSLSTDFNTYVLVCTYV